MEPLEDKVIISARWEAAQIQYRKKIHSASYNSFFHIPGYSVEDMEQELLVELWKCCLYYDPNQGATFNTFFWNLARNRISMLRRESDRLKRITEKYQTYDSISLGNVYDWLPGVNTEDSAEDVALANISIRKRLLQP